MIWFVLTMAFICAAIIIFDYTFNVKAKKILKKQELEMIEKMKELTNEISFQTYS